MLPRLPLPNKGEGESLYLFPNSGAWPPQGRPPRKMAGAGGKEVKWRGELGPGAMSVLLTAHTAWRCVFQILPFTLQYLSINFK